MKKILILIVAFALVIGCKNDNAKGEEQSSAETAQSYTSIGKMIEAEEAFEAEKMAVYFKGMMVGDTMQAKMRAKVDEVCQAKGCWMKLNLGNGEQVMVKFKDYGFFMPKDIAGKEVIINGFAFVEEMSVDEQKHYAKDAGEPEETVEAITRPKKTYSFEADGVLLKD